MFIKFKTLRAKNYKSIGNTWLELDLDKNSKTLIAGTNGAGKSTLMGALTFALFGRDYAKVVKANLVNSVNLKECIVELAFEIGKTKYLVRRGLKPAVFEIIKDGELITQAGSAADYQAVLEETIIKMNFKSYTQLISIGSMSYTPFLQLKAEERRAFVETMLDIEIFSGMNKKLKSRATLNNTMVIGAKADIRTDEQNIQFIQGVIADLEKNQTSKLAIVEDQLATAYTEYQKSTKHVDELTDRLSKIIVDDSKVPALAEVIRKCQNLHATKSAEAATIRKKIQFMDTNPVCPTCEQAVDDTHKHTHISDYNSELNEIGTILGKLTDKEKETKKELDDLNLLIQDKRNVQGQLNTANTELTYAKAAVKRIHAERETIKGTDSGSIISDKKQQLVKSQESLAKNIKTIEPLLTFQKVFDIMALALKDSGAKAEIVKNYVPIICHLVNNYLQQLNLFVKFELDEGFNETLKSRQRDEFTYESFSMGERARINIALLSAWRDITKIRTGVSTNLLFFDEVLEILDESGFDELLDLVTKQEKMNCFIISHKSGIDVKFDDVITVRKVKGFTQIKSDD